MSNGDDPAAIIDGIADAQDAFEHAGFGQPTFEEDIDSDEDWTTQLTKACQLIDGARTIREHNGHYTAVIELCFGAIERSVEAYVIATSSDAVEDFRDHEYSYERAHEVGLFETETAATMRNLYSENRTESYYGGGRPTDRQAEAMADLAHEVHRFVTDQIREGGVCVCDS